MSDEKYIEIGRYWNNELSPDELILFQEKIASDSHFAEEVTLFKEVSENIASRVIHENTTTDLKNTLNDIITEQTKVIPLQPSKKKHIPYFWIAASLVILLGVSIVFNSASKPDYQDYINHDAISLTVRGSDNVNFKQAEKTFNTKQYKKANAFFNILLEENPNTTEIKLYKAIALIELNNYKEADALLQELSKNNKVYRDEASWYLGLSKLKQKKYKECKKVLLSISSDSGFFIKSKKLLEEL